MSVIQVQSPGLLSTVQDLGREGFGPLGVSASGAADAISLRLGNRLLGNPEGAAALEMTLLGGTFLFAQGAIIALTGSDFAATLDGSPLALWTSVEVKPGQTLRAGSTRSGARCYLCVQGGIIVKPSRLARRCALLLALRAIGFQRHRCNCFTRARIASRKNPIAWAFASKASTSRSVPAEK